MKPTQEKVIAWAREAGMERCDCEPRCHLHTGGMGSLTALVDRAYEAGRKDENEACAQVCEDQRNVIIQRHPARIEFDPNDVTALKCAAAIRARREQ